MELDAVVSEVLPWLELTPTLRVSMVLRLLSTTTALVAGQYPLLNAGFLNSEGSEAVTVAAEREAEDITGGR